MRQTLKLRLLALGIAFVRLIQPSQAEDYELQSWDGIDLEGPIYKNILIYADIEPRINLTNNSGQLFVRSALGYDYKKKFSLWAGYIWPPTIYPRYINENRPFQQFEMKHKFRKIQLSLRARLEERFIEHVNGASIRQRILGKMEYFIDKKKLWAVFISNELFINYNSLENGPKAGLDQDRLYCGISRRINKNTQIEGGYMYNPIYQAELGGDTLRSNIVIRVHFIW